MSRQLRTAALVLAAGSGERFGGQKVLTPLRGKPLVRWAVENALESRVERIAVVAGDATEEIETLLEDLPAVVIPNPEHEEGMSSSIRAGVKALSSAVEWVLVLLGDQPFIGPAIIDRLLEGASSDRAVVAPFYRGQQGNPVLFHASLFPELLQLEGDVGARAVVERDPDRVARVELDLPLPRDVDTREDLRRLETQEGEGE